jgi:eukaryotic-like serine/threonine-protein kinase
VNAGPFSSVWEAYDETGDRVAIKVVNVDNLSKGAELSSFRRGVVAMRFLTDARVRGTAALRAAYEIPACVVMDYVDGPTLEEVVQQRRLSFWGDGIQLSLGIGRHLARSHRLEAEVLHRDVRPSNIVLNESAEEKIGYVSKKGRQ